MKWIKTPIAYKIIVVLWAILAYASVVTLWGYVTGFSQIIDLYRSGTIPLKATLDWVKCIFANVVIHILNFGFIISFIGWLLNKKWAYFVFCVTGLVMTVFSFLFWLIFENFNLVILVSWVIFYCIPCFWVVRYLSRWQKSGAEVVCKTEQIFGSNMGKCKFCFSLVNMKHSECFACKIPINADKNNLCLEDAGVVRGAINILIVRYCLLVYGLIVLWHSVVIVYNYLILLVLPMVSLYYLLIGFIMFMFFFILQKAISRYKIFPYKATIWLFLFLFFITGMFALAFQGIAILLFICSIIALVFLVDKNTKMILSKVNNKVVI